ncbi:hypothetical protein PSY44_24050, partial [Shigella flexneri]|nr:hypothetical protein [Shigella flexneri]
MACGEFSLIARYFDRVRSSRLDVELGIKTRTSYTVKITGNQ